MNIPIFVISLARATERRQDIIRRLESAGLDYEIIDAVDGQELDSVDYKERLNDDFFSLITGRRLLSSEIGCYLSHYKLWERMTEQKISRALILEDDATWDDDLKQVIADVLSANWEWDVCLLYSISKFKLHKKLCRISKNRNLIFPAKRLVSATAYLIRLQGAQKLKSNLWTIREQLDFAWGWPSSWGGMMFAVYPFPVRESIAGNDSLISNSRTPNPKGIGKIVRSLVRKSEIIRRYFWFYFRRPRKRK